MCLTERLENLLLYCRGWPANTCHRGSLLWLYYIIESGLLEAHYCGCITMEAHYCGCITHAMETHYCDCITHAMEAHYCGCIIEGGLRFNHMLNNFKAGCTTES